MLHIMFNVDLTASTVVWDTTKNGRKFDSKKQNTAVGLLSKPSMKISEQSNKNRNQAKQQNEIYFNWLRSHD